MGRLLGSFSDRINSTGHIAMVRMRYRLFIQSADMNT